MYSLWRDLSVDTKIFDFVTLNLTFDLLLKKLNLGHNFWNKRDRAFIFHIFIPCDKTFLLIPIFWPSSLNLDFDLLLVKLEFVAAGGGGGGGISPVWTDPDLVFKLLNFFMLMHNFISQIWVKYLKPHLRHYDNEYRISLPKFWQKKSCKEIFHR